MAWQASKFGVGMVPTEPLNESFVTWGVEKDFGCFKPLMYLSLSPIQRISWQQLISLIKNKFQLVRRGDTNMNMHALSCKY